MLTKLLYLFYVKKKKLPKCLSDFAVYDRRSQNGSTTDRKSNDANFLLYNKDTMQTAATTTSVK